MGGSYEDEFYCPRMNSHMQDNTNKILAFGRVIEMSRWNGFLDGPNAPRMSILTMLL
jgi:hypothetical protein